MHMAGFITSIVFGLLLLGFNALASGCQSMLSTYLRLSVPLNLIDIGLLVIVILIVVNSRILLVASIGLVILFMMDY